MKKKRKANLVLRKEKKRQKEGNKERKGRTSPK
jgi:hypothetical protein